MDRPSQTQDDCLVTDDRPIALRRKRRSSAAPRDEASLVVKLETVDDSTQLSSPPVETPKPKKKVRFSDPGPEREHADPSLSTGLTPAFSRTSFDANNPPTSVFRPRRTKRQASLPNIRATALPSPSPSFSPGPFSGEIQFLPWCDIMDDRSKRRIKRNHLSEEQNEYDANKKLDRKTAAEYQQDIQRLRAEIASIKKQQMHGEAEGAGSALKGLNRERELEQEIQQLKQEMNDRESSISAVEPHVPFEPASESDQVESSASATYIVVPDVEADREPEDTPRNQTSTMTPQHYAESGIQTSMIDPEQSEVLRATRLNLEYLFPGEITLGLVPENLQALLDAVMERLQMMRTRALIAEDALSTSQTQEANLRSQFHKVLEQLERARSYGEKVRTKHDEEKTRADTAVKAARTLKADCTAASRKIRELESGVDEKEQSMSRLQEALGSYRDEVGKLETLITRIENDHKADQARLKSDMDEAVADLEGQVVAETSGRREAEAEVDRKNLRIAELQGRETDLKNAINEKQRTIRSMELAFSKEKSARARAEQQNGVLNRQNEHLNHNVRNSDKRYEQADQVREILTQKLKEQEEASHRTLAAVRADLECYAQKFHGIQDAHLSDSRKRSADVLEHKGLLTPTTGGRFRDMEDEIEGLEDQVEVHRGKKAKKKRPDSGVVILEEDEDEDVEMDHY